MTEKSVSFRKELLGSVADLLADIHCERTNKLVIGLVSLLAAYTEEGHPLRPSVFVCNSIDSLIKRAGTGEYVPLSESITTTDAARRILKIAAPLCFENWRIYVERSKSGAKCRFGVFCGSSDPASLSIEEVVFSAGDQGFPVIRIAQTATNKVQVRTSFNGALEFRFNDDVDLAEVGHQARLHSLAEEVAREAGDPTGEFASFIERILTASVMSSHGTIIAVLSGADIPAELSDAVALDPKIDLFEKYTRHRNEGMTAQTVSRLQTSAELLGGFIRSDGITVLNPRGQILAYHAFVKTDQSGQVSGGARTRAFETIKKLVGKSLRAAYFRSQDGRSELKVV